MVKSVRALVLWDCEELAAEEGWEDESIGIKDGVVKWYANLELVSVFVIVRCLVGLAQWLVLERGCEVFRDNVASIQTHTYIWQ